MDQALTYVNLDEELKSHDFKLLAFNNDELRIKGISSVTRFMIIVMSFIGLSLLIFGFTSLFFIANPEYVAGILLSIAGIVLIILPFYNYYSRSYFEIYFNRSNKSLIIKRFDPLPGKKTINFSDITAVHLKKNTLNSYVDDKSKGSFIYNYSIYLKLKDQSHNSIIQFSKRDEKIELFSNNFADILVQLIGVSKEFEMAK